MSANSSHMVHSVRPIFEHSLEHIGRNYSVNNACYVHFQCINQLWFINTNKWFHISPQKVIQRRQIIRSWRPIHGSISWDDLFMKIFFQQIDGFVCCMARCTILLKPEVSYNNILNFWQHKFIDHYSVACAIYGYTHSFRISKDFSNFLLNNRRSSLNRRKSWTLFNEKSLKFSATASYKTLCLRVFQINLRGSPYETPGKKVLFNDFRLSRKKRYTSMIFYIYFKLFLKNIAKKNQVTFFHNGGVIHGGLRCLATGVVERRAG